MNLGSPLMKTKSTKELAAYAAHTIITLPDNLPMRKVVLNALLQTLPMDLKEERNEIAKMLEHISAQEQIQKNFVKRLQIIQQALPFKTP